MTITAYGRAATGSVTAANPSKHGDAPRKRAKTFEAGARPRSVASLAELERRRALAAAAAA